MNKKKIKPLLPVLKEKKRYIAFEIQSEKQIGFFALAGALSTSCLTLLGELGMAQAGVSILPEQYNKETKTGVIRVNNKFVHPIKAALAFTSTIQNQPVLIRSLGISGILNKTKKYR
jgi:ribonuclease P/MRP protein subunit POP5